MKRSKARPILRAFGFALTCVFVTAALGNDSDKLATAASTGTIVGRVTGEARDGSTVNLRLQDSNVYTVVVADKMDRLRVTPAARESGKPNAPTAETGNSIPVDTAIKVEVDDSTHPTKIIRIKESSALVSAYFRVIAIGGAFIILLLLATLATKGNPLRFLIGLDNRYSNSQTQLVLWFGALAVIYVATVVLRILMLGSDFVGGVGVTANVIALTGLSALSFGGAKVITTTKTSPSAQAGIAQSIPAQLIQTKPRATNPNLLTDLFQNDQGDADFGDFQMILVTLAAVGIFLVSCFVFLGDLWPEKTVTLPDIDTALLSTFGVGQGAYLLKKAAMKPGEG